MSWFSSRSHAALLIIFCLASLLTGCAGQPGNSGSFRGGPPHILFKYRDAGAKHVSLVGDFNRWSPHAHNMRRKGDTWLVELSLKPGRYQYAFLVDGATWRPDPEALLAEDTGFGTKNSILIVE